MKRTFSSILNLLVAAIFNLAIATELPRVIVLTDAETDDRCSMVHFLLHANDMQVDGIIQTNSCFQKNGWSKEPWLEEMINAYAEVYPNLKVHDPTYPAPEYLMSRIYIGDEDARHIPQGGGHFKQLLPGTEPAIDPSEWPDTPGSDKIVEVLLENDPRQVFIQCWGGGNTAAKAFDKLKAEYPDQYERAIKKAVLYCIWYQDGAGPYIEKNHPDATILLNHHFNGSWDYGTMTNTTEFVDKYMHNGNNPLGDLYTQPYISEGDTPAFLYSLENGLRSYEDPTYGGWGGRFYKVEGMKNVYRDTGFGQLREWIEPAMHDFQARLQWCVTPDYNQANHKPMIEVPDGLDLTVCSGDTVRLKANITDPDAFDVEAAWKTRGDMWAQKGYTKEYVAANPEKFHTPWRCAWWQYPSGTYPGNIDLNLGSERKAEMWFIAPEVDSPQTIHIILEAYDMTAPRLTSYARYIVTVLPSNRHRILISTDIGGTDPDDNQSMIHLLMYANEFDIEGLVSSPSFGEGSADEIRRMIAMYEKDRPMLSDGLAKDYGTTRDTFPTASFLESITVQGANGGAPLCGFRESTDGSDLIIKCARKEDSRPLWILVWGALEDVAQALHDAPDIADRIRIYWIGGPNKKWGCNAYNYIVETFPSLWFIENNATYRGFIGSTSDKSEYGSGFFEKFMKGAGTMSDDFINYYNGMVKMGDTPSLLYLMHGQSNNPESEHWGGRFDKVTALPRYRITGPLCDEDTVSCYAIMEWIIEGPELDISADSACFTLTVDRQNWPGYYAGDGKYIVRYAPKAPGRLPYTITSEIIGFPIHEGCFTVKNEWPGSVLRQTKGNIELIPYIVGRDNESNWFTDTQDYTMGWQGSSTIARWRNDIMQDWSNRFKWLSRNRE